MDSVAEVWKSILEIIARDITPTAYNTWFADCEPVELEDCKLVLHTATDFKRNIIQSRFGSTICAALYDLFSCDFELQVLAGDELEEYLSRKKGHDHLPEMDGYTFDRFVVGPSNKFAHAAAVAVAENPGKAYNPLFIYGNSGLGKTHLLLAIGEEIHARHPEKKIAYVKGDDFTNQMIQSVQSGTAEEFRQKYRNVDLFLVDDVQFIAGKQATQEEFFHTFNNIYEAGHQIVITSDRPPLEMSLLDDRLRTRFEGGLIADIQPPDTETKIAILKQKAFERKAIIPPDVLEFLARDSGTDVRTLEGRLTKVVFASKMHEKPVTMELAATALREAVSEEHETVTSDKIIGSVCSFYKISKENLLGKSKKKELVLPRQICAYLMCEIMNIPLVSIGETLGGRDHTTVIHSREKVSNLVKVNDRVAKEVEDIRNMILKQ